MSWIVDYVEHTVYEAKGPIVVLHDQQAPAPDQETAWAMLADYAQKQINAAAKYHIIHFQAMQNYRALREARGITD